jgi:serine/threonine protein kinase
MVGISYPIVWKTSPNRTEIAIISKCNEKEKSLAQFYFEKEEDPYRPPSVTQLCSLAIEIVHVIEKFHSKRVIHGRLRPDVIGVWEVDGRVQVCIRDFSESRILGEGGASPEGSPTAEGEILTVPPSAGVHYLPPETLVANQLGNSHLACFFGSCVSVDRRADFYSLGTILHHLLTGKPLFHEYVPGDIMTTANAREVAVAHRSKNAPPPTAGEQPLLDGLVLQLLQKSPDLRYQSGKFLSLQPLIS